MNATYDAAIAAIATAPANGAVGIIRISGAHATDIADRVFFPKKGRALSARPPRTLCFGTARDASGCVLDNCLATFMPGPQSYTGEDVVELHCHGGAALLSLVLEAVLAAGARMARAGEFTRRAFLNGKLDLTQAEAVADLIAADWDGAVKNAAAQLSGSFGARIRDMYTTLRDCLAVYTAAMDYADQNVPVPATESVRADLAATLSRLEEMLAREGEGQILQHGLRTAVVGRPNAGKSSVFNRLVGFSRSIVTEEAGTTRDVVSEKVCVGGVPLLLCDTAGIRRGESAPERAGIDLARAEAARAGLVLAVFDVSAPLEEADLEVMAQAGENTLCILNKSDLAPCPQTVERLCGRFSRTVSLSALTGEGMEALGEAVAAAAGLRGVHYDGTLVTSARQRDDLRAAAAAARDALQAAELGAEDAVWGSLSEACECLGRILGIAVPEDVENEIFSRFCIGK